MVCETEQTQNKQPKPLAEFTESYEFINNLTA